jgi:TonB-linked SusC/RagA family outer membrane protein
VVVFFNIKTKIMQKSVLPGHKIWYGTLLKSLLVMKLVIVIILFSALQVKATPTMGQNVSLKVTQTEIRKVLKAIESDGFYRFLYNSDLAGLKKKVDFTAQNLTVTESLTNLFAGTNLTFKQLENNLIVVLSVVEEENVNIKVTGKVTGENGEALAGASVQERGTNNGTFTDNNGNFTITTGNDATLVITSIGYEAFTVKVSGRSVVDVKLLLATRKVDEVVVIGYGTASKRDLTGSVAKVKGDVIASQPNTNPLASLQSKVAGLSIVNSALPGSTPDVRIRGTISIGSVSPVYIIDGIFSNNMDFVNPSEIESLEILKDPSSLAVFGIKGAAGAILVTTKKAKAGQLNINFNSTYGVKQLVDKIKLANGDEFRALLIAEANNRVADDPSANSLLNFINNVGGPGLSAYNGNTDWVDAVTRKAAFSTSNLSVDGSSEKNRFHMGLGYTYDEGLVKHIKYDRLTLNLNDEYKINRNWKVGFNLIVSKENLPYNSGALENARRALPIIPNDTKQFRMRNPYGIDSGNYNLYATTPIIQNSETNPLASLENSWNKRVDNKYRYVGNAFVDVNITKNLNFRGTWYADISNRTYRGYTPLYNLYDPVQTAGNQVFAKNSLTAVNEELNNTKSFQQDYILTYKKRFGQHSLTATGGFTTYYSSYEQLNANINQTQVGINIIPDNKRFWYLSTGFGNQNTLTSSSGQSEYATVSGLARVLYNYQGKYFLNASFRRDGASQISQNYNDKFQNFWAIGAAWEITKEYFMENQKIFNFLKLKASTGLLGNFTAQGKNYPAYPTVSTSASAVFGNNLTPVYTQDYLYDPNLHWETVMSSEVGFEADLLNNRLHVEVDYYNKKTEDLLVLYTPPGILPTLTNAGAIQNSGFELTAGWNQQLMKDLTLSVSGNLTTYKNKVLSLDYPLLSGATSQPNPNQSEVGKPIGYFYGLVVAGVYQSYADILASPVNTINGGGAKPGDLKYKDVDGNGKIDDNDRTSIGNPTPDFTYGVNLNLKYKGFDLGVDLAGVYGNEVYRVWGTSEQKNSVYNYPQNYTQGWTAPGSSNWVPVVNQLHLINRAPSTYGIEDGSYFRIRNLSLGYNITKLPKIVHIKNARVFVSVQNLKTWKHNEGYSPEFAGGATYFGIDNGGAGSALPRITTVGLNINF